MKLTNNLGYMTYQTMSGTNDMITPVQALGLLTSVYLVIRGFDRYRKALDERKKNAKQRGLDFIRT